MGVEGGAKILKFLVFFFNFIFFIFGCVLVGVGAWVLVDSGDYVTLTKEVPYATGPRVLIAAGALVAIVAFLGCCGAWKENRCMLVIFFILLLVILSLEIAAGVLGYKNRDKEKCCGWYNYTDWYQSKFGGQTNRVPDSCCKDVVKDCGTKKDISLWYQEGCKTNLEDLLKSKLKYVGAIAVAIIVIQLLGMIFAAVLICKIGDGTTYA
ncbi:hypothetical protein pdam_00012079 [Pocillopora damicornis]|uniref:Tetraspanin n=1 Tax=Pocillopora damicornis TaxID=46731 RepID=A0A3M6V182_POCDA|nr:hypothetical protein pdam_00012079 [Pocillopora damicornis]